MDNQPLQTPSNSADNNIGQFMPPSIPLPNPAQPANQPSFNTLPIQMSKVSLNPFAHFFNGNKALFSTNPVPAILATLITVMLGFGIGLLYAVLLSSALKNLSLTTSSIVNLLVKALALYLVSLLVSGYFYAVATRTVLTGTRRERVSFGSLFPFVAKRYLTVVLTFLMVGGIVLGIGGTVVLGAFIQPILGVLLGIIAFIFLLIFAFRMFYILYIALDDEQPQSPGWILKRSSQLWKKSGGALIIYCLTIGVIGIVFSILTKLNFSSTQSTSAFAAPSTHSAIAYGSLFVASLVEGIFGLLVSAAIGHIYNQAKLATDGNNIAPPPPVNPYSPPPTNSISPSPLNPPTIQPNLQASVMQPPTVNPTNINGYPQAVSPHAIPQAPSQPVNNYPQPPHQPLGS